MTNDRGNRMLSLLEYVNQQERPVPVSELVDLARREFAVSEVTLRSDLSALCSLRGIRKTGRGMYEVSDSGGLPASGGGSAVLEGRSLFGTRLQQRAEGKIAIAGAVLRALARQEDLRVLLLDAGSTTYYVADRLAERAGWDLIVWTPSVLAASRLAGGRGISVRLLGGEFQPDYAVVSGDETARALRALAGSASEAAALDAPLPWFPGTHCVLDVNYLSPEGRLFTDESKERLQKRLMTDLAQDVTIVADQSKLFGRRLGLQAHEICSLEHLAGKRTVRLVTDAPDELQGALREVLCRALPRAEISVDRCDGASVFSVCTERKTKE